MSVEELEVRSFFARKNTFLRFLRISYKGRTLGKRPLFIKCSSLNYASIGSILNKIGATGDSVDKIWSNVIFWETKYFSPFFWEYLIKDASYRKRPLFIKCSSLNYASVSSILNKIGAIGESVQQFEVMLFFERNNTFLRFLRISHKGRILEERSPLYKTFVINLRVDWWHFEHDRGYGWVSRANWSNVISWET